MGACPFYDKRCSLVAPCCGATVCCHRCHDEVRKAEAAPVLVGTDTDHQQFNCYSWPAWDSVAVLLSPKHVFGHVD